MTPVSLIDVSTYLPGEPIGADYYAQFAESDDLRDNLMFRAPKFRHHVAAGRNRDRHGRAGRRGAGRAARPDAIANVDVLITHTQMPDMPFYGGGGGMAHRLGMRPSWVLDLHNGGCAAFVLALQVATQLLSSGEGADRVDRDRAERGGPGLRPAHGAAQAAGRRCPVTAPRSALVTLSDESPILDVECRTYGEYAGDMTIAVDPPRKWWQPGPGEGCTSGSPKARSPRCWPAATGRCPKWRSPSVTESACNPRISTCWSPISPTGCSCATGARRWSCPRSATSIPSTNAATCSRAGIPINLDRAITDGQLKAGDVVMMAAFAHAGDFAGAAAVSWGGRD